MGTTAERLFGKRNRGAVSVETNAKEFDRQVMGIAKQLRKATSGFTKGRKRQVARAGAGEVRKVARRNVKKGNRVHYRYVPAKSKGAPRAERGSRLKDRIEYRPGNLRKTIGTMTFRRSTDAFVVFGLTVKKADPYYAAMAYGSEAQFNRQVLAKAKMQAGPAAYRKMALKSRQIIDKYYKRKRLKL